MLKKTLQTLPPSSFAFVMATGIVGNASQLQQFSTVSTVLFWLNNIAFFSLLILFALRLLFFFPAFIQDLSSHEKGAGFLTMVAGSCILGTAYAQARGNYELATVMWVFGGALWMLFIYAFLSRVILKKQKPSPETGMNGIWLLLVVSTQSLSILGCVLSPHIPLQPEASLCLSLLTFLLGVMLYLMLIPIDLYRLLFFPIKPEEVVPSYWINMGAAAITGLAGVMLSNSIQGHPLFGDFYFFIKAISVLFWATGSFWIPVILIMEIWRYGIKNSSLKYETAFWSLVFPLGMYTVCSWQIEEILPLPFLHSIARVFLYIAWAAWLLIFLGFCIHLLKQFGGSSLPEEANA